MIDRRFFTRDVLDVGPDLVGRIVRHGPVALRITETEAYRWPGDTACHARHGKTARNAPLFGAPGIAYIYLCYGLHQMLNIVTGPEGEAQAVLVRAGEVVDGHEHVRQRRGGRTGPSALAGPGKVGQALGIDTSLSGQPFYVPGGLELHRGQPPEHLLVGTRVGIDYAEPAHIALPWRFADAGSKSVSHRSALTRIQD